MECNVRDGTWAHLSCMTGKASGPCVSLYSSHQRESWPKRSTRLCTRWVGTWWLFQSAWQCVQGLQDLGASFVGDSRCPSFRLLDFSRVRKVVGQGVFNGSEARKFRTWLALSHGVSFPSEVFHLTEFLQTRHSEPCNRGSLKVAHNSFIFLEETAGVEQKLTQQALYGTMYKELLATAEPDRPTKTPGCPRGSPREEHSEARRSFLPQSLLVVDPTAVLGHTPVLEPQRTEPRRTLLRGRKLAGSEARTLQDHRHFRLVVVSPQCFVSERSWLSTGWMLLKTKANYSRDYLLPAPSARYSGCVRRELGYDAASAVQTRILQSLSVAGELVFQHRVARYWTSAAAALNVPNADRDMLGDWAAGKSERYARVSRYRITIIQQKKGSARTITGSESTDPLCELEAREDFAAFLKREGAPEADSDRCLKVLSVRTDTKHKKERQRLWRKSERNIKRSRLSKMRKTRLSRQGRQRFRSGTPIGPWAHSCFRGRRTSRFVASALVLGQQLRRTRAARNSRLRRIPKATFPIEERSLDHGHRSDTERRFRRLRQ